MKTKTIDPNPLVAEDEVIFCADTSVGKIGCVLLQAAYGGSSALAHQVGTDRWLLAPTPNLRVYRAKKTDIPRIIQFFQTFKDGNNKNTG